MKRSLAPSLALMLMAVAVGEGRPPNVVIFYADDMGIGDVGCYGCRDIATPQIDALARQGMRFTNYYSAAPLCSPSRAALMTGRYPSRAGVPSNVGLLMGQAGMPAEEYTVAECAKSAGYATGLVGKWHLGSDHATQANAQGFDYFYGYHACIDYWSHFFYYDANAPHYHDLYRNREEVHEDGVFFTDLLVREALAFIDDHKDKPFLLYVPFHETHYPMHAPRRFAERYLNLAPERREYAALVASLDEAIGRIMRGLGHHNLVENTVVIFSSDNGPSAEIRASGSGGSTGPHRGNKFSLLEGGIRMPAIVSWPGHLPQNETRDQLSMATDVLPTVAEAIGARLPADRKVDGASWLPLLKNKTAPGHEILFWEWNKQHAVRQGQWKVMRNVIVTHPMGKQERMQGDDFVFLVDLEADPGETKNLYKQHREIADRLLEQHDAWHREVFKD